MNLAPTPPPSAESTYEKRPFSISSTFITDRLKRSLGGSTKEKERRKKSTGSEVNRPRFASRGFLGGGGREGGVNLPPPPPRGEFVSKKQNEK